MLLCTQAVLSIFSLFERQIRRKRERQRESGVSPASSLLTCLQQPGLGPAEARSSIGVTPRLAGPSMWVSSFLSRIPGRESGQKRSSQASNQWLVLASQTTQLRGSTSEVTTDGQTGYPRCFSRGKSQLGSGQSGQGYLGQGQSGQCQARQGQSGQGRVSWGQLSRGQVSQGRGQPEQGYLGQGSTWAGPAGAGPGPWCTQPSPS